MYCVVVERSAEKDLRKLQLDVRFRVADALRSLANDVFAVHLPKQRLLRDITACPRKQFIPTSGWVTCI